MVPILCEFAGQVKFLIKETDRTLGLHTIGASQYYFFVWRLLLYHRLWLVLIISFLRTKCWRDDCEGVLAVEYGARLKDISRTTYAHVSFYFPLRILLWHSESQHCPMRSAKRVAGNAIHF